MNICVSVCVYISSRAPSCSRCPLCEYLAWHDVREDCVMLVRVLSWRPDPCALVYLLALLCSRCPALGIWLQPGWEFPLAFIRGKPGPSCPVERGICSLRGCSTWHPHWSSLSSLPPSFIDGTCNATALYVNLCKGISLFFFYLLQISIQGCR